MSFPLYNRDCYVEIGVGGSYKELLENGFDSVEWVRLLGLDVKFDINHPVGSASSNARISILGLSYERIYQLTSWAGEATAFSRCILIRVYAGYGDKNIVTRVSDVDMIFQGYIINAYPTTPPEMWLNIEARSYFFDRYSYLTVDLSEASDIQGRETTVKDLLAALCASIGFESNLNATGDENYKYIEGALSTTTTASVFATLKTAADVEMCITKICDWVGLIGVKHMLPDFTTRITFRPLEYPEDFVPKPDFIISEETGMVGVPKMEYGSITVTTLLCNTEHDLRLNFFGVRSKYALPGLLGNGGKDLRDGMVDERMQYCDFICTNVAYKGHLRGNEWYATYIGRRFISVGDRTSGTMSSQIV